MTTAERPMSTIHGETRHAVAWPSIDEIVREFENACSLLADFAALHDDVVARLDRRSARASNDAVLTVAQCRQWVTDRRQLVEAVAIRFGALEPRGLGPPRVEQDVVEALDIITGGTTAAQAVYLHELLND